MILNCFPGPPPPTPTTSNITPTDPTIPPFQTTCISAYCTNLRDDTLSLPTYQAQAIEYNEELLKKMSSQKTLYSKSRRVISDIVSLLQLSITAAALGIYYIIYCYMQLIYFALKSAIYFHNADGPMKITIAVVSLTSLVVGFNLLIKVERYFGFR